MRGDRIFRVVLAFAFFMAATLKIKYYFIDGAWGSLIPLLRDRMVLGAIVTLECLMVIALFVDHAVLWASWVAAVVAVTGNFAYYHAIVNYDASSCGCFGPREIGPVQHGVLSVVVFALATRVILKRSQGRRV
jgi:hypothetical protein